MIPLRLLPNLLPVLGIIPLERVVGCLLQMQTYSNKTTQANGCSKRLEKERPVHWVLARCWTCAGSFRLGFSIRSWMPTRICTTTERQICLLL